MSTKNLIEQLTHIEAVRYGEFTLKSGRKSSVYVDMRRVISFPKTMRLLADAIWERITFLEYEAICGVPYSAIPFATTVSIQYDKPLLLMRKEAKAYGTGQWLEGVYKKGDRVVVIEDVITTGNSLLDVVKRLEDEGIRVTDLVCIVDREEGARELLTSNGYNVHSLLTLSELTGACQHEPMEQTV